jgi:prepilin-type N-terminal cleavage/methylation domain-containing protein
MRRLDAKGFTLVELIVAMTVSLIIIGITTALLLSGTSMTQHTTQRAFEEQIADGVFNYAEKQLRFAGTITGLPTGDLDTFPEAGSVLYIGDTNGTPQAQGMLFCKKGSAATLNVLGDSFYAGYSVSLDATLTTQQDKKPAVTLTITLYKPTGEKATERKRSIALINGALGTELSTTTITSSSSLLYFAEGTPSATEGTG